MKFAMKDFSDAIEILLRSEKEVKGITVFCNPLSKPVQRVRVTRKRKFDSRSKSHELIVSYGALNYSEKEYAKKHKICPKMRVWFYPKKKK